jgi:hypothetical protein
LVLAIIFCDIWFTRSLPLPRHASPVSTVAVACRSSEASVSRSLQPIRLFRPPHALAALVWHRRSPSVSRPGRAVRAASAPRRDARVFRPCSRNTDLSCGTSWRSGCSAAAFLPAPIGWGSPRKYPCHGCVNVTLRCDETASERPLPTITESGSRSLPSGVSA